MINILQDYLYMIGTLYKLFFFLIMLVGSISTQLDAMHQFEEVIGSTKIMLVEGDLFKQPVGVIVNAANSTLLGGGGIDKLFHEKAGPKLVAECARFPEIRNNVRCEVGAAKITGAHDLSRFKNIIHTVGPLGTDADREEKLHAAYTNSLQVAHDNGHTTIAFPAISAKLYFYDVHNSAPVALKAMRDFVTKNPHAFTEIRLVVLANDTSKTGHTFFDEYHAAMTGTTLVPLRTSTEESQSWWSSLCTRKNVIVTALIVLGCYAIHKWLQYTATQESEQKK